jgi:hypothetical protein
MAQQPTSGHKYSLMLAYADDIDIIGRSQAAFRDAYLALERKAKDKIYDCGWQ